MIIKKLKKFIKEVENKLYEKRLVQTFLLKLIMISVKSGNTNKIMAVSRKYNAEIVLNT